MKEFISRLTWADWAVLIGILRGCYVGYRSGFFPELLRIAAYVVTVVITFRFHEAVAQHLTLNTFLNQPTAAAVAFLLLLILAFLTTKILTLFLLRILKVGEGNLFYRLAGLALGGCRWMILLSLLFMLIDYSPLTPLKDDIHQRSLTGPQVSRIAPLLFDFLSNISPQLSVEAKGKTK